MGGGDFSAFGPLSEEFGGDSVSHGGEAGACGFGGDAVFEGVVWVVWVDVVSELRFEVGEFLCAVVYPGDCFEVVDVDVEPGGPCVEGLSDWWCAGWCVGGEVVAPAFDGGFDVCEVVEGGEVAGWCGVAVVGSCVGL